MLLRNKISKRPFQGSVIHYSYIGKKFTDHDLCMIIIIIYAIMQSLLYWKDYNMFKWAPVKDQRNSCPEDGVRSKPLHQARITVKLILYFVGRVIVLSKFRLYGVISFQIRYFKIIIQTLHELSNSTKGLGWFQERYPCLWLLRLSYIFKETKMKLKSKDRIKCEI